jgi:hypothetical protein
MLIVLKLSQKGLMKWMMVKMRSVTQLCLTFKRQCPISYRLQQLLVGIRLSFLYSCQL